MITTCEQCGGLRAEPGEMFGGKPCECRLRSSEIVSLPSRVVWDAIEELRELLAERDWWKTELRCNYQARHAALSRTIDELVSAAWQANDRTEPQAKL